MRSADAVLFAISSSFRRDAAPPVIITCALTGAAEFSGKNKAVPVMHEPANERGDEAHPAKKLECATCRSLVHDLSGVTIVAPKTSVLYARRRFLHVLAEFGIGVA